MSESLPERSPVRERGKQDQVQREVSWDAVAAVAWLVPQGVLQRAAPFHLSHKEAGSGPLGAGMIQSLGG